MATIIHPTAIVETDNIGDNVEIGPFCYITDRVVIEDNVKIYNHVILGTPAHVLGEKDYGRNLVIKSGTIIRELTNANTPITDKDATIRENCFIMAGVHITHDIDVGENSILCVGFTSAGHFTCGKRAYIGLNTVTHQHAHLGAYCMLGAGAFFKGVSPRGLVWAGVPARPLRVNTLGLDRWATAKEREEIITEAEKFLKDYNK